MQTSTDTQLRELAHKRVDFRVYLVVYRYMLYSRGHVKFVDFRVYLVVYCIINAILWITWLIMDHGYMWPVWPMFGWGIGVIFHYTFRLSAFQVSF